VQVQATITEEVPTLVISDPIIRILEPFYDGDFIIGGSHYRNHYGGTISTDEASVPDMSVGFMVGVMVGVIGKEGWHRKGFLHHKWAT
jgi:hypothetical protein